MAKLQSAAPSKTYSKIENDVYDARVIRVILTGVQKSKPYKGKPKPDALVCKVAYELIDETVTVTDAEGNSEEVPAVVYQDFKVYAKGANGPCAELFAATLNMPMTPEDSQDFKQLIGASVSVTVGSYVGQQDGVERTCVDGVAGLGKRAKASLPEAASDLLFFDCYDDSDEAKTAYTNLGDFVRGKLASASDSQYMACIKDQWPTELAEDGSEEGDEF